MGNIYSKAIEAPTSSILLFHTIDRNYLSNVMTRGPIGSKARLTDMRH